MAPPLRLSARPIVTEKCRGVTGILLRDAPAADARLFSVAIRVRRTQNTKAGLTILR
jgi:hypothetical protein